MLTAWRSAGPTLCFPFVCAHNFKWDCQVSGNFWCYPFRMVSAFHSSAWIFLFTPRIFSLTLLGSGDAILCADHPILGQVVIVLLLDYPNCYESQDAFSSGHVERASLPHRSDARGDGPETPTLQIFLLRTRKIELKRTDQNGDDLCLAIYYVIRIPVI